MSAIVYVPGLLGSHLRRQGGERIWFEWHDLWKGTLGPEIALAEDGISEAEGHAPALPDGHLSLFYGLASVAWRTAGITVHEFSYDWRKSVTHSADELARYIAALAAPVTIVAHSMGGLAACEYATRHSGWRSFVERAILIGTPLRGSFSSMEALTGEFRLLRVLAALSAGIPDPALRQRRLACALPGLLDLLPDPEVFPSAAMLYAESCWTGDVTPPQRWLDSSLALKRRLATSPLLERAVILASKDLPTPVEARFSPRPEVVRYGEGDGLVPLESALHDGVPAYAIRFPHSIQTLEPAAIAAVRDLVRGGTPDLPGLARCTIGGSP